MNKCVGVVAVTNKLYCIPNIINNYNRQNYKSKRLYIVLNNNKFDKRSVIDTCKQYNTLNYTVTQIPEHKNLGYCINRTIPLLKKHKCYYFTKFDDDDNYGSKYITEMINAFNTTNADVVGKRVTVIYTPEINKFLIPKSLKYGIYNKNYTFICGSTISFKLTYLDKIKIKFNETVQCGTDSIFIKDVHKHKGIIHSTSMNNYIWIRHRNSTYHTWKIDYAFFKSKFNIIHNDGIYRKMLINHMYK